MSIRITVLIENAAGRDGLAAEPGLSLLLETSGRSLLFDSGLSAALVRNAEVLGLRGALSRIEAVVLSHGHDDHTGGLTEILRRLGRTVPVYVGSGFFVPKVRRVASVWNYIGIPATRADLEGLGARIVEKAPPGEILPGLVLTNEIPRREAWEEMSRDLCFQPGDAEPEADPFVDEQVLAARTPSGLVVLTGCAHRGLMNGIAAARTAAGEDRVRAVFGGSHLAPSPMERVRRTAGEIAKLAPELVALGHCTGRDAERSLAEAFGARFAELRGGRSWTF